MKSWLADKSKLKTLIIITSALLLATLGLGIYLFLSFFGGIIRGVTPLESGEIITIERGGNFHIYFEDTAPPPHGMFHIFTFTNTSTGEVIRNQPRGENWFVRYNIGNRQGERIATVELPAGQYILEFAPLQSSGIFTNGLDIMQHMVALLLLGFTTLLLLGLVVWLVMLSVWLFKIRV
ncbi:MAG: hypothetical protein FWB98_06990 [Defluviitaleaceae bacterium]|nr:hypothetical protein [Defluviitaleaceae bacterium]